MTSIYDDLKSVTDSIGHKRGTMHIGGEPKKPLSSVVTRATAKTQPRRTPASTPSLPINMISSPPAADLSMAEVAAMILPPLTPLRDNNGFIYDSGALAARCQCGHIHKYYIRDILVDSPQCTTCKQGNRFTNMVREIAEHLLGVPFVASDTKRDQSSALEYINPILKITLVCLRWAGVDIAPITVDGQYVLSIRPTNSYRKVLSFLAQHLIGYALLNDKQRMHIRSQFGRKKMYKSAALPFTQELALLSGVDGQPWINIASDEVHYLRLENC
jgi:hypothetical protein